MKKEKIAFLISSLGIGGAEHVVKNLAEHYHEKGYEVMLVTSKVDEDEYSLNFNPKRVILEDVIDRIYKGKVTGIRRKVARGIALRHIWNRYRPTVIVSFLGKLNIYAMLSKPADTRVYLSVRSDPHKEYPGAYMPVARRLFCKSDGVAFQTQVAADCFGDGVRIRSSILPNALDESFMVPPCTPPFDNRIVMVGRIDENKNHKMVIEALAECVDNGAFETLPTLEIYGDSLEGDHTADSLKLLGEELGVSERVIFKGRCADIRQRIDGAGLFVLASGYEGMPNALLEAMAAGLPVISTDCPCGGPASVLEDGENGLLIPVGDKEALKTAMVRILNDREFSEKLGRNAAKIQNQLSPERVLGMWDEFLGL